MPDLHRRACEWHRQEGYVEEAIHHALEGLGFAGVNDVRAGKLIELDLAEGTSDADIEEMCRKLLANTVIENFKIERLAA